MPKGLNKDIINLKVNLDIAKAASDWSAFSKNVYSLYNQVNTNPLQFDLNTNDIKATSKALAELQSHMAMATNPRTGNLDFSKLSMSLKDANADLAKYGENLLKLGPQGVQAFSQLTRSVAQAEVPVRRLSSMMGEFGTVMKNTIRWQLSSSLIHGFMGSVQQAFNYAQNLNRSLNDIRIVTGQSNEQMAQFAETANKAARALSSTTVSYTDAALIYYQQGIRDQKEIEARTNATIKMANVTGQSAAKVSDQMTAIWNNFAEGSTNLEYYADVITALGAATASSSEEISRGLEKFASIADTVGLSYENATAALATITATTRNSADSVGTGLRTLFSRLQSVTLGKTLEDGVNLSKYSKALETVGVQILSANGELRTMDDILEDLGERWDKISDAQKVALAQTVGGVRQYTTLMALMDNFDFYKENQIVANEAEGTLDRQQKIYEESWAASSKRVRAAAEEVYGALIDDKFFIKLNDVFASSLGTIGDLIKGLGGVRGALFSIGSVASLVFKDQIANKIGSIPTFFTNLFTPTSVWRERQNAAIESLVNTQMQNIPNISGQDSSNLQQILKTQATNNQWFAENKDSLSPRDLFLYQTMSSTSDQATGNYLNAVMAESNLRDASGNLGGDLYTEAMRRFDGMQKLIEKANTNYKNLSKTEKQFLNDLADNTDNKYITRLSNGQNPSTYNIELPEFRQAFQTSRKELEKAIEDNVNLSNEEFRKKFEESLLSSPNEKDLIAKGFSLEEIAQQRIAQAQNKLSNITGNSSAVNSYSQLYESYRRAGLDKEEAARRAQEAQDEETAEQKRLMALKSREKQITSTASAFMSLGMAISQTNGVMNQWQQVTETGEGAGQALLSTITAMPMSFMMLSSSLKNLSSAYGETSVFGKMVNSKFGLGGWTAAIQAAVAIGAWGIKKIKENTTEAQLEKLQEQTTELQQRADSARQAYDTLLNQKSTYSESLKALDKLREGTIEYRKALLDANAVANELISTNNLVYGKDWTYNTQGVRTISQEALDKITESSIKQAESAEKLASYSQMINSLAQSAIPFSFDKTTNELSSTLNWADRLTNLFSHQGRMLNRYSNDIMIESFLNQLDDENANKDFIDYVMHKRYIDDQPLGNGQSRMSLANAAAEQFGYFEDENSEKIKEEFKENYLKEYRQQVEAEYSELAKLAADYNFDGISSFLQSAKDGNIFNSQTTAPLLKEIFDSYALQDDQKISFLEEFVTNDIITNREEQYTDLYKELPDLGKKAWEESGLKDLQAQGYLKDVDSLKELTKNTATGVLSQIYEAYYGYAPDEELLKNKDLLITSIYNYLGDQRLQQRYDDAIKKVRKNLEENGQDADELLKQYENYQDLSISQIQNLIKEENEVLKPYQDFLEQRLKEVADNFVNAFTNVSTTANNDWSKKISEIFTQGSFQDVTGITSIINDFSYRLGNSTANILADEILKTTENGASSFYNFIKDVDKGETNLQTIANMRRTAARQGRRNDEKLQASIDRFTEGRQGEFFQELYSSDGFSDALETVRKEFETTGDIGVNNILKIARSSEALSELLKESGINAAGVADALKLIEEGTIRLNQTSSTLLESLSLAGNVEAGLADTFDFIDNYEAVRSGLDIGKFAKNQVKTIQASWTAGAIYDPTLLQGMGLFFGTDFLKDFRAEAARLTGDENLSPDQISNELNERYTRQIEALTQITKTGDLSSLWEFYTNNGDNTAFKVNGKTLYTMNGNGQVEFADEKDLEALGIRTRDDLEKILSEGGMSKELANMITSDYLIRNAHLANWLDQNGAEDALNNLLGLGTDEKQNNKNRFITESDLRALYEAHPEFYNGTVDDFIKQARQRLVAAGSDKIIVDFDKFIGDYEALSKWAEENITTGNNSNKITNLLNMITGTTDDYLKLLQKGNLSSNMAIENMLNGFRSMGYSDEDAWNFINQYTGGNGSLTFADNGKVIDWLRDTFNIENDKNDENDEYDRLLKYLEGRKDLQDITTEDIYRFQQYDQITQSQTYQDEVLTALKEIAKNTGEPNNDNQGTDEEPSEEETKTDTTTSESSTKVTTPPRNAADIAEENYAIAARQLAIQRQAQAQQDFADQIQDPLAKMLGLSISQGVDLLINPVIDKNSNYEYLFTSKELVIAVDANTKKIDDNLRATVENFGNTWNNAVSQLNPPLVDSQGNPTSYNGTQGDPWWKAMVDYMLGGGDQGTKNTTNNKSSSSGQGGRASGYNNIGHFASGKNNQGYEGIAETGELGPELWIHDGKPYLTGIHGRTKVYIHPDDQIWTAAQTKEILRNNPSLQDIPGFSVGYRGFKWGGKSGGGSAGGGGEDEYEPERYHVITRQLAQLTQQYEELSKVKENAYGTNKLDAIQREIDMTNTLIEGQRELIKQAEEYAREDRQKIVDLELDTKLEFDENGNITNWEDVETELGKKAKNGDKTAAENLQKLKQYEESVDKWNEAQQQLRDYIYQLSDLTLEKITTKVELIVDMDDREINFIDHFIDKLDDKVGDVAEILTLTGQKLEKINDQIEVTRNGLNDVIKLMRNDYGEALSEDQANLLQNVIDNVGGQYNTAQEIFDALDPLHINESFGKQIESYVDDLLKYIEAMDKLKKEGIDKLDKAFDELNKNISDSMNLFSYYNDVLSKMKDITELQGTTLTKELRDLTRSLNQSILDNSLNNLKAERQNQARLQEAVRELQQQVENETDDSLRRAWEDELKKAEKELQDSTKSVLSLIQDSLEQAKTMFENALDGITEDYEKQISGMYGTTEELSNAFDRKKEIDDFYVDDYEKYYQIAKLQRSITGDIDKAARAGNKSNQGLKKLLNELNAAREDGVELTAYDLDVFAKRYEYEKALMELEDARNDKSEVRLQRDANGNWGYVYTSAADEDDLLAKQQAVDDKLYEWQKTVDNQADEVQSTILNTFSDIVSKANEMLKNGESQDAVQDYINDRIKALQLYSEQFGTSLSDALQTLDIAKDRYGKESFDMLDNYGESILSSILGVPLEAIPKFITDALKTSFSEANSYSELIKSIDTEGGYKDFISGITGTRKEIDALSDQNRVETISAIGDATTQFTDIMNEAIGYEDKFLAIYGIQIEQTERELERLLDILDAVNRIEYDDGEGYKNKDSLDMSDITRTEKPSNGGETAVCNGCGSGCGSRCIGSCVSGCGHGCGGNCSHSGEAGNGYDWRGIPIAYSPDGVETYYQPKHYATGGYTGSWGKEGKLAILHEKEQVFNKDDTEKLLNAASILRTIDLQADIFGKGLTGISIPQLLGQTGQTTLDQNVHIDATFPNVTDHNEIEMAFDNLVNKASQYANRKNMSSMTFQDMYTSKF